MPCSTRSVADRFARTALVAMAVCAALAPGRGWASATTPQPPVAATSAQNGQPAPQPAPPATAPAPDAPVASAEQQARAEFERGQRQYDLARFDRAIGHYSRAYELLPLPAFLFNIAQCHRQLGEYRKAAFFYRRYLDTAESPPNAEVARTLLKEVEAQAPPGPVATRDEPAGPRTPLLKRKWFWVTAAGVVVAGAAAGAIYATRPEPTTLGTVNAR